MRIEKASEKAIQYACLKFHYAKRVPLICLGYSVFNDNNHWCGVVVFSLGAAPNIAKPFGLVQGQVIELVRVALNGKQKTTSEVLAKVIRQLKKDASLVQIIVSYADRNQNHIGIIYQATNWICIGEVKSRNNILLFGKSVHSKSVASKYGKNGVEWLQKYVDPKAKILYEKPKIKYIYPMNKRIRKQVLKLAKPYPKKEN